MKKQYITTDASQTKEFAKKFIGKDLRNNVILLKGDLGAGKTTFAQGVLKILGAEGPFTSPTFVILKRYELNKPQAANRKSQINSKFQIPNSKFNYIYHFDCYRVEADDIHELGWEEIISNPKNLVLVEWPERIKRIWPKEFVKISFEISEKNKRRILINSN